MIHNRSATQAPVAIVGGGPVGLFLALALHARGVTCRVLERQSTPWAHSRAIGIHPVSLDHLGQLELSGALIRRGVKVERGVATFDGAPLGELSFRHLPPPHCYVLSLPQDITEAVLERALAERAPGTLLRGAEVTGLEPGADQIRLTYRHEGATATLSAGYAVGCDGLHSQTREAAGITLEGHPYHDSYVMGDYDDNTDLGAAAAIHLHEAGVIEAFPLPGNKRRWVARVEAALPNPQREDLDRIVRQRLGHELSGLPNHMLSGFGVQWRMARRFVADRVVLAGDAAHVVSPLGGQGMNLGWGDAWQLAGDLAAILAGEAEGPKRLARYERDRRRAVRAAMRRSEFNMWMGRPGARLLRRGIARLIIGTPLREVMARVFTMRGL